MGIHSMTYGQSRMFWSEGRLPLGIVLYSSNEPGELCHDVTYMLINIIIMSK